MIYNFLKYLKDKLTLETADFLLIDALTVFGLDGLNVNTAALNYTGGTPSHKVDRTDNTVQVLTVHEDVNEAENWASLIYNTTKNFFHVKLPEITVKNRVYPELDAWQISPMQTPAYIGTNEGGFHVFSFNLVIVTS